ncbi:MAG: DNA (cytosine-5-)-methyltransferase [Actinomycetota bacterium]|nr:DNA (cytosine-5-)-methyltransferase [Rubrobacter sp.]MDQ3509514.1 DNA (cytosine-5-)-methyltransferase [Actinomycetota bacterium]
MDSISSKGSLARPRRPVALSLFSGAGGLDIGFHRAGFEISACVENESAFCETLRMNRGGHIEKDCRVLNRDITSLAPEEIGVEGVDFIIGGPPCQSFSAIGRRAGGIDGTNNERGNLFEHYCRLVRHFQPRGFLFENVRGILDSNRGEDWRRVVAAFSNLGYELSYRVLDSADYGVPQHRERLFLIGFRDGEVKFPRPTHGPDSRSRKPFVSALDAVEDIQDSLEPMHEYTGKYGSLLEEVPPGYNYHYFTREMGHPEPVFAWRSRFSDFLHKADPDKPVKTIVAQLGKYSGPFHWKNRKFTLDEFKRLQTFPDDYEFAGGMGKALRQIGNSVPPRLAERLAEAVMQQIFDEDIDLDLLEGYEKLSFDSRKSRKAKSTRATRSSKNETNSSPSLFDLLDENGGAKTARTNERFLRYQSPRKRVEVSPDEVSELGGDVYRIREDRVGGESSLEVARRSVEGFASTPMLRYSLRFHFPIGDGLHKIDCVLLSDSDRGLPVAWDAIEDVIGESSGYQSMLDIHGHFAEPRPIFDLEMELLAAEPSFLLRFAKHFSVFSATRQILPARDLEKLHEKGGETDSFDLSRVVRELRELRFDVRVNETNSTIPPGHFRCCYPFTININKQISVAWKETSKV